MTDSMKLINLLETIRSETGLEFLLYRSEKDFYTLSIINPSQKSDFEWNIAGDNTYLYAKASEFLDLLRKEKFTVDKTA